MPTLKLLVRKIFPHALEPSRAEAGESKSGSSSTTPKAQDGENVRPANKDFEKGGKTGQEEVDVGSVGGESDTTRSSEPCKFIISSFVSHFNKLTSRRFFGCIRIHHPEWIVPSSTNEKVGRCNGVSFRRLWSKCDRSDEDDVSFLVAGFSDELLGVFSF